MNIETFNEATLLFGIFVVLLIIGQAIFYFLRGYYIIQTLEKIQRGSKGFDIQLTPKGFNDIIKSLNGIREEIKAGDTIEINGAEKSGSFTFTIVKKV